MLRVISYSIIRVLLNNCIIGLAPYLNVIGYSYADWVGDPLDRCSINGYCSLLVVMLVTWRSKKQTIVGRSTVKTTILNVPGMSF